MHGKDKVGDRTVELLPDEADDSVRRQVRGGRFDTALRDNLGGGQRRCAGGVQRAVRGGGARTIAPLALAASWYSPIMSITHGISPVEST